MLTAELCAPAARRLHYPPHYPAFARVSRLCFFIVFVYTTRRSVDLLRFHEKHYLSHYVISKGRRVDFSFLGNKMSVTKRGYLTLYISVNIPSTVEQIEEIILAKGEAFLSFTCELSCPKSSTELRTLHLSEKFSFKTSLLFHRLKGKFQTLTNIIEITLCGSEEQFAGFVDPKKLPADGCTWTSLQLKVPEGKLCFTQRRFYHYYHEISVCSIREGFYKQT